MIIKLEITANVKVETGLHIGASVGYSAIGSVDSPVVRDVLTDEPYIPASSLKGKLRYLLHEKLDPKVLADNVKHDDDDERILRLFGAASGIDGKPMKSRLVFSDLFLSNGDQLKEQGIENLTEVKFENTINRFTAVANPRQIERVIRGSEFACQIIYSVYSDDQGEMLEDLTLLNEAFNLLEYDYLGGSGSRGYGRVAIEDRHVELLVGELENLNQLQEVFTKSLGEV